MPALVGGFGNFHLFIPIYWNKNSKLNYNFNRKGTKNYSSNSMEYLKSQLGPYLAGLIEGDGTFAIHDTDSKAKKYSPKIIIVFKKADLPLAQYLKNITNCGDVLLKQNRGYVLWQIQDLISVFKILKIINGYMRTPKIEALNRTITWFNEYIHNNKFSKLPKTQWILSQIHPLNIKGIDNSSIESNAWLSGFSDADSNFSINIHKRSNKNSIRVQLYYRIEIKQNYPRLTPEGEKVSFFSIMSILANYFGVNVLSRSRNLKDKQFYSFTINASSKSSLSKVTDYFNKFPLISSKYLDYKDFCYILNLQNSNSITSSYINEAVRIITNFNKTRTTYNWDHLNNCYINNKCK